ncbi:MAG: WYL domain-containing protein, partial [Ruminococcus sp.]|nr:WYL domain-containing protein [Ruminococcus sp.]
YIHDFDAAQIRWLMDAVLFSREIPVNECKGLIEQISKLGNIDSRKKLSRNIGNLNLIAMDKIANPQLLLNIEIIDEAIEKGKQIAYIYNDYGKDKKLHPRLDSEGNLVMRIVNPYSMLASNGRYYMVCNYDEYDNATNVRVDKITDIELLDTPVKPKKQVKGLKSTPSTIAEQIYMQPGKPERVVFKLTNNDRLVSEMIDWFGNSIKFTGEDDKTITCEVKSNLNAMKFWAMQYSDHVEIIEPEQLRENIRASMRSAWRKYNDGKDSLIESNEGIKKLISEWEMLCNNLSKRKEEECVFDLKALENLVKQTHIILLPFFGQKLEGQYAELMLSLKGLNRMVYNHRISDAYCTSLIMKALIDEVEYAKRKAISKIPEDVLPISIHTEDDGHIRVDIDINNFEEDYLTLKQYTDKNAEKYKQMRSVFSEKAKERMNEIAAQRRKER